MTSLFPRVLDDASFDAVRSEDDHFLRGVEHIWLKHKWTFDEPQRFSAGSLPVYRVGPNRVIKLFPPHDRQHWQTERTALEAIGGRLSIGTPQLEAANMIEGWGYIVMSHLAGVALSDAWPEIPAQARTEIMQRVGAAIAELHALPIAGLHDLRVPEWLPFIRNQAEGAVAQQASKGLDRFWLDQIADFLRRPQPNDRDEVFLHTEIMREHLLVEERAGRWNVSGLVDFEPSMLGAAEYEFASVGIFVTCGDGQLLRSLLLAYGFADADLGDELRDAFMRYALLHRYSNLRWYLERMPPPPSARTLDDLASLWFGV